MIKIKKFLKDMLLFFGLRISRVKKTVRYGINLNVGCGQYEIDGFESLDFYSDHYYKSNRFNRVRYDIRKDSLPYNNENVNTIFCSHVIEHIETKFVSKFFNESYRVLKPGGVLRIVCPDAQYLYMQYKNHPCYYQWHPLYETQKDAELCFIDEVAGHKINIPNYGLNREISEYKYDELISLLREGGEFDSNNPSIHINSWDFNRISQLGYDSGFNDIQKSQFQSSYHPFFQAQDIDIMHPVMSLYVDLYKS